MLIILSHVLAFSTLFIAGIWDLYTTDVPDFLGFTGVIGGITLHGLYSITTGSPDPLVWSFGAGLALSIFGWGMYLVGMWGGADAFAMSVLGFAAPFGLSGTGILHGINLVVNVMLVGMVYSLLFAFYRAIRSDTVFSSTLQGIKKDEKRISIEILLVGLFSGAAELAGLDGIIYFASLVSLVFLYRFLKVLEQEEMTFARDVSELEPGDVVSIEGLDIDEAREKNATGRILEKIRSCSEDYGFHGLSSRIASLEERFGYPEIVGITEDEIEEIAEMGVEKVDIKTGARFVPVFPVALLLTDVSGLGIIFLLQIF